MNKPIFGLFLGGFLGIFDGLKAWFTPAARAGILSIVIGSKTATRQPVIDGGLLRRPDTGASTVNTVDVNSVDEVVDTEGNTFGIMQSDSAAA